MWRGKTIWIVAVLVLLLFRPMAVSAAQSGKTIIIALDPGHGGEEDGAWYYGKKEKDLNWKIAELVRKELEAYEGVSVVMTRQEDEKVGLLERVIRASNEQADLFISLHLNASVSHRSHGATVYVTTSESYRDQMCELADYMLGEFEAIGLKNNGTVARVTQMGGRRADGSFDDYYGVLRHSTQYGIPSLLVEHCFMDSEIDQGYLIEEKGLDQLAKADANAIAAYFDLTKKDGTKAAHRHARVAGATTGAIALQSYEPPNIEGIRLIDFAGTTPGIATYEIRVKDENAITSLYLVYQNENGDTTTVSIPVGEGLKTGGHEVKAMIPALLEEGTYQLLYVGGMNEAGFDCGYNYEQGKMVGFGKCQWLNTFEYQGEADLCVEQKQSEATIYQRWMEYEIETGLRDKKNRPPAIVYPDNE